APTTTISITDPSNNTTTYASTIIGTGGSTCWPTNGTANYRADVTAAINGSGNYNITLNGFANVGYEVDGVSIIMIYADPTATYSGSISLWDGCIVAIGNTQTSTESNFAVCAATNNASAFGIFADCQSNSSGGVNTDDFNGSILTFTNDFWNFNVIPTTLTNGQTSCVYDGYTNCAGDCWAWVANGLYWQNTSCVTCTPPSAMVVTFTPNDPTCGNLNGFITTSVTGGTAPYTYTWSNGGTLSSISGLSAGTYYLTVRDNSGCDSTKDTITLVTTTVRVTPTYTNVLCNGQCNGAIHISASGGVPPFTFTWSPSVGIDSNAINLCAGSYTVSVSDNNGCTTIDTLTVTQPPVLSVSTTITGEGCNGGSNGTAIATGAGGTPPYKYQWNNGQTTDTATGLSAGTYTVTVIDSNTCSATNTATVTQPAVLNVSLSGPQTICNGDSGTLTATVTGGTSPYAYSWSGGSTSISSTAVVSPTSTTTYTVNITDANGCVTSATIVVSLGPPLSVIIKGAHSVCSGANLTICAVPTGGSGGDTYVWQPGNLSGPCVNIAPSASTTYTLTVTDNCGTPASATTFVPVNPLPNIVFSADVMQGCAPLCIQFRDKSTIAQGQIVSWAWRFGSGDTADYKDPIYCYPDSGHFGVTLTTVSDSGCSATLNILNMITVYGHPNTQFSMSPQPTDILHANIQFTDNTTDSYGLSYWFWNFGDGTDSTSNLQNPTHTYQDTGTFCASMVAMNIHGCTDTATNCLVIDPSFSLYIPDAFTPNGNGRNDVFMVKGQYITSFEMYIFDRWGTQLFYTNDINTGWNGTVKGGSTICQEDTYVYKILVKDAKNKQHNYVGAVTLIK
ncbi:MAG TPA: PKD domain-containing protein, partial [Bacteroidia bacterium]|nr:PKD domain-containing protein [Bacteroidia bacterium]